MCYIMGVSCRPYIESSTDSLISSLHTHGSRVHKDLFTTKGVYKCS